MVLLYVYLLDAVETECNKSHNIEKDENAHDSEHGKHELDITDLKKSRFLLVKHIILHLISYFFVKAKMNSFET